jgi:hypothetical protein
VKKAYPSFSFFFNSWHFIISISKHTVTLEECYN